MALPILTGYMLCDVISGEMFKPGVADQRSRSRRWLHVRSSSHIQLSKGIPPGRLCSQEVSTGRQVEWSGAALRQW